MRVEEKSLLAICLFLSLLLASGLIAINVLKEKPSNTNYPPFTPINVASNLIADKEDAQNFINANEILTHFESISTQVGIGTVTEVTSRIEVVGDKGRWTIITYAKILVRIPLSDNIESGQIIGTKYSGGEVGDRRLIVNIDWCYGPNDTAMVPSVFKLEKGLDIIFFIDDNTSELRGYVPSTLNA